jgi:hypothetical protein
MSLRPMKMVMAAMAAGGLVLAGGCSQTKAPAAQPAKPSATPVGTLTRRDGIWKLQALITKPSGQRFAMAELFCVGPPWETVYMGGDADRKGCSTYDFERQPNGDVTLHSVCDLGAQGHETDDRLIQGDLQTKFTQTTTAVTTGAAKPEFNGVVKGLAIATWERTCKPSEKPGNALAYKVITEAGAPTAPADLDPAILKDWKATK